MLEFTLKKRGSKRNERAMLLSDPLTDKAKQYIVALEKWLKKNPNASQRDRLVAESMKNDLQCALAGK